jgi:type IV pilus assembly protein PilY1
MTANRLNRLVQSAALALLMGLSAVVPAGAADVDLANAPLVSGLSKTVPPNIHFVLDDSGSMAWDYMPDDVNANNSRACFKNFGYNKIYYNPAISYLPPVRADGTSYANQSFTNAAEDGFGVSSASSTNLAEGDTQRLGSNPFATLAGSNTVTVTDSSHGQSVGASVRFSGVSGSGTVNGVTGLNSTFTIASVINANTYTITAGNNATNVTRTLGSNPLRTETGGGSNPKRVTVTDNGHGRVVGDTVTLSGVSGGGSFRGVTGLNDTFTIASVVDADRYTIITTGPNATSAGTGGGTAVVARYPRGIGGGSSVDAVYSAYFYYQHTSNPTSPPITCATDGAYTKKQLLTAAEKQNFANWYSYYRTRINMMKSASGRAFAPIDDKFRVGLDVISNNDPGTVRATPARFDGTNKSNWYTRLYAAGASGSTPLRAALSKAGRLYAGKVITGDADPVQYSCQQNFTILTTDGYWNLSSEVPAGSSTNPPNSGTYGSAASNYGPYREDNRTVVGDQDGIAGTPRPYLDAGKYANSIADVAMYYYKTDLRPTGTLGGLPDGGTVRLDVSTDNVPAAGADTATHQHMTTFALGLGVAGTLAYDEDYLTGSSADYNAILQGTKNWPNPDIRNTDQQVTVRVDDTWHAAVNGRGQYLSASNPDSVIIALRKTLAAISVTNASAAAAATSSLEPVAGDNYAYVAQYTTGLWYGDLLARTIDLNTGTLSATIVWSGQTELSKKVGSATDSRTIYTFDSSATALKSFESANLTTEITAGYFKSDTGNPNGKLTQFDTWSAAQKTAATSDAMINFIRGQTVNQGQPADTSKLFRDRTFALGDIVNAAPVFVHRPPFAYADPDYAAFVTAQVGRKSVVYAGANDGMLHAFDAETGEELWGYIPSVVVPQLYRLADAGYANNHRFYVDGPIAVGDAYDGTNWRTILVAGLGGGGKAYIALDVTDPDNPEALWEFGTAQDDDMGYSYGNPILTKRPSDGRWVVLFASGYNNNGPGGDGKGRLYVVDAISGAMLSEIITDNAGTDPDQSGIAKINNFVTAGLIDNTTEYVYGGDLAGNLWRFDLRNDTSQRLGRTSATVGSQPITVRPELARIRDSSGAYHRVVYFGTGRYLGFNDLSVTSPSSTVAQAYYAVKDTGADIGVFATSGTLVEQTLNAGVSPRSIPNPVAVDWLTKNGWFVSLPVGERVSVDLRLQLGTLVGLSNKPESDYCSVGGTSWLYAFDYKSGAAVSTSQNRAVGFPVGSSIATGLTLVRLPNNKLVAIVTQADTTVKAMSVPVAPGAAGGVRRVGWREIP